MSSNGVVSDIMRDRQVTVQRRNLIKVCSLSVKTMIDKSCNDDITDNSEELVNFIAVIEHVLMFQMKPHRSWYKSGEPHHYWNYIRAACKKLSNSCIRNVESIENIRTNASKARAWIRLALMEKRLAEYLSAAQANSAITKMFYEDDAIIGTEDGLMLSGLLIGLNAIDFSFCLKGCTMNGMGPLIIDYSKYIDYPESVETEGVCEQYENTNASCSMESGEEEHLLVRYKFLEGKHHIVSEQKDYLEELVRVRSTQLQNLAQCHQTLRAVLQQHESESRRDTHMLEMVVLELQQELADMKEQNSRQQCEIASLRTRLQTAGSVSEKMHDKMMQEIVTAEEIMVPVLDEISTKEASTQTFASLAIPETDKNVETFSLVPLAGSLTSEPEVKVAESSSKIRHDVGAMTTDIAMTTMSPCQSQSENPVDIVDSDTMSSDQSVNGNFEVILPEHIDGTSIEGEVEIKGES